MCQLKDAGLVYAGNGRIASGLPLGLKLFDTTCGAGIHGSDTYAGMVVDWVAGP